MKTISCYFPAKRGMLLLFLLLLAACTSRGLDSPESRQGESEVPTVRLTVAIQEYVNQDVLRTAVQKFEAANPGVEVELIRMPADRYDESLHMMMTSGEGPDLFNASTGWLATYLYKNWLLDLSEWVEPSLLAGYPAWAIDYTRENSHFYAIPSEAATLRLVYNKKLFRRAGLDPDLPPGTLAELRQYASRISQAGEGYRIYGFALPAGENEPLLQALEVGSTRSGLYYYGYDNGKYDFSVYAPWFELMLHMKQDGGMFPGETSLTADTALTQFAEGNIGMMYMTNREFVSLSQMMKDRSALGIALPPVYDPASKTKGALMITLQAPLVVHNHSEHKAEAVELWKWLHDGSYQEQLYRLGVSIPLQRKGGLPDRQTNHVLQDFQPGEAEAPYPQEPKFILENRSASGVANVSYASRTRVYKDILLGVTSPREALLLLSEQYNRSLGNAVYRGLINMEHYIYPDFDPLSPMNESK
ncbi:MAG: putative rane protein [Paenibacillaceae bacterium]|jgi:multiple sugar transport system substrate-binding protein|nr:putative rane protein [Paenibacillaceae bacterium]